MSSGLGVLQRSAYDPLTGLANRTALQGLADGGASLRTRTLIVVDLDDFKAINDSYGQAVGDLVLQEFADRLRRCARPHHDVVRLGADEFAVLLHDEDVAAARDLADRLLEGFTHPLELAGRTVFVRASVGIATSHDREPLESLLRRANASMNAAKTATSNEKVVAFDGASHQAIIDKLQLTADLRGALGRGEFSLRYQPIVAMDTRDVVGFEALLRWQHPARGNVPPLDFITIAEEAGLMPQIGEWILETAAREAARWHARSTRAPHVSVNFSARQFQDVAFLTRFDRALAAAGLPAEKLVVELTETAVAADLDVISDKLAEVRSRGARVYLDDFGTGYSSLSYIRDLPIDGVKLDRAFCQDIVTSHDAWALAQAVVTMLDNLNLGITAEGVETAAQLAQLRSLGCAHAQGYYFDRPLPVDELDTRLPAGPVEEAIL